MKHSSHVPSLPHDSLHMMVVLRPASSGRQRRSWLPTEATMGLRPTIRDCACGDTPSVTRKPRT
ncbi:hypothetical protein PISMIDRAFT_681040 [Pisolithus microcarpus 441]|uniref:Uncharacterized protein n=1 Tax=Pisolithus microcarpus 441 TaxID=765257 RepID=A0A0C9YYA6_9AGAM|nr:hypothetical protein PISMIDRAFT_681040 [Pisolithus microcarpus 441]